MIEVTDVDWDGEEEERRRQRHEAKRRAAHKSNLKNNYGITPEQYGELLSKQGGACAICSRGPDDLGKRLAVDHNHHTGEIRGLLCSYCNHRLVGRHRDSDLLRRIAEYLDNHTGWFVPKKKKTKKRRPKRA